MQVHLMQAHYAVATVSDDTLDDAALDTWRAFLTAHALVTRRISKDLTDAGLPDLGWYDLLWALRRSGGRLRVNELAREVVLSPTAMSRFVDRAVAAGVVAREPDPDDRRAQQVVLTGEGRALLRRMWPVYRRGIAEHFAQHLDGDPGKLSATLGRMADSARRQGV